MLELTPCESAKPFGTWKGLNVMTCDVQIPNWERSRGDEAHAAMVRICCVGAVGSVDKDKGVPMMDWTWI